MHTASQTFRPTASSLALLVAMVWSLSAVAAPVVTVETAASAADGTAMTGGLGDRPALPQAAGETKTIDLLIELQPRTAGLTFNERERIRSQQGEPRLTPVSERRDAVATDAAAAPSGLFGAGATPMVTSKKLTPAADSTWRPSAGGGVSQGGGGFDGGAAGRAANAEIDTRWLWVPRELVRFVRENRELVIGGAVGLLALLWAGSMAMTHGGRR